MKVLLLSVFLIPFSFLIAQENNLIKRINWSEKHNISGDLRLTEVIPYQDGFYTVRENKNISIGIYDKKMNLEKEIGFDPTARGKNWTYEGISWLDNQFQLFSSFYDIQQSMNILYSQVIEREDRGLKIGELRRLADFPVTNKYDIGAFDILDTDSGEALMTCSFVPNQSTKTVLQLRFFDAQFSEKLYKNIILPFEKENLELIEKRIDRVGNFYLLARVYQKGRLIRRNGAPNYEYVLMLYKKDAQKPNIYHLEVGNYLITDLKFDQTEEGSVILAGLISDAGNAKTNGICYFKADIDRSELVVQVKSLFQTMPISLSTSQNSISEEEIKMPRYLKIDHLFLRSDGGVLLIAERSFQVSKHTYQDDDILIININSEGAVDWVSQVPKKQSSYYTEDVVLSYFPFIVQDKIYLIYNDDGRNFSYNKQRRRIQRHKTVKGFAALTEVQKDGSWKSYPLSDNSIEGLVIHPQACEQIGRKTILVYEAYGNTYRFGKLELK